MIHMYITCSAYIVQFSCSVVSDSLWLLGLQPPGFTVHQHLLELAQTYVHWVGDAIQPSHPLSSPSPPAFNLSQHQGLFPVSWLFASGGQSIGASASASVLPMNSQDWFLLGLTGLISLQSKGLSGVFSTTTVQKHQFFGPQISLWSNSHIHTLLLGKAIALTRWTFVGFAYIVTHYYYARLLGLNGNMWWPPRDIVLGRVIKESTLLDVGGKSDLPPGCISKWKLLGRSTPYVGVHILYEWALTTLTSWGGDSILTQPWVYLALQISPRAHKTWNFYLPWHFSIFSSLTTISFFFPLV